MTTLQGGEYKFELYFLFLKCNKMCEIIFGNSSDFKWMGTVICNIAITVWLLRQISKKLINYLPLRI